MSDLQIGLIILGLVLIGVLLAFNWWQDRRVRRRMQQQFQPPAHDPLLDAEQGARSQTEPVLSQSAVAPGTERREPGMGGDTPAAEETAAAAPVAPAAPAAMVTARGAADVPADSATEALISISFAAPVSGADLLGAVHPLRQQARKSLRFFAFSAQGTLRQHLTTQDSYASLHIAVQLANRAGAISQAEWLQIWSRAQDVAKRCNGKVSGPEQAAVLEQAVQLDRVAAALDAELSVTLALTEPRPAAEVLAVAHELGFQSAGGVLAWMSEQGLVRFTLARGDGALFEMGQAPLAHLSLLLDVPRSPADEHAFGRMVKVGRDLAARLDAHLIDDNGRPLADGAEKVIDQQLVRLYAQLDKAGLTAGSARALRVFS
ncbi:cell division protein ZipA C-terminal FtsZ-binding domain-containing protein [Kerstersia similis]|uniref:cell division protein ZipA C-terminal FtsZ-binding domain-containing protein n=1 Tax=Kerstersia similis TaxID=206505 RepID=UPI0039F0649B